MKKLILYRLDNYSTYCICFFFLKFINKIFVLISRYYCKPIFFNFSHDFKGQQQIIKIFRNSNQPLTQESVKAIVKEVTGQQDSSKVT